MTTEAKGLKVFKEDPRFPELSYGVGLLSKRVHEKPIDLNNKQLDIITYRRVDLAIIEAMRKYGITRTGVTLADYRWFVEWWLMCDSKNHPYINSIYLLLNELCNHSPYWAIQDINCRVERLMVKRECI